MDSHVAFEAMMKCPPCARRSCPAVCVVALERRRSRPVSGCIGLRRVPHGDAGGN